MNPVQAPMQTPGGMIQRQFSVRFLTPAFLGNADQSGQWRTPPFKHLLREWWRVAWASRNAQADWKQMRELEAQVFGHAWLKSDRDQNDRRVSARKSQVLLRLDTWDRGTMGAMPKTKPAADRAPQSAEYLGFGPAGKLGKKPAISAAKETMMRLAWPAGTLGTDLMDETFSLIQAFGTLGGRSRNGWGSVWLDTVEEGKVNLPVIENYLKDWRKCLDRDWAHAIGCDEKGPLIWKVDVPHPEWTSAIESLAAIRKTVNREAGIRDRKVLNQPVGGKGGRVPSNLRFKIRKSDDGKLQAFILHVPFTPPGQTHDVEAVWEKVHDFLDRYNGLKRSKV